MSDLDDIVSISITADSTTVSREGFGTVLVLSYHTRFVEQYRIYSSLAEMLDDGFTSYDDAYRMARAIFAQDPTVTQVVVGRLPAAPSYQTRLTMTSATEGAYVRFKVVQPTTGTATQIEYLIPAAATTTSVATAVELLVEAVTGVDSSASSADVTVTPTTAGRKVHIYDLENCTLEDITADAGYDDELTALEENYDDWYFVTIDSQSVANMDLVATWVATRKKIFFVSTSSSNLLTTTASAGTYREKVVVHSTTTPNDRVAILWSPDSDDFGANAWIGDGAPLDPGAITWCYRQLDQVTSKRLTTNQKTNLDSVNCNYFIPKHGANITMPGKVLSGEWIDIVHGLDALESRIQEDLFALFLSNDKVPKTATGFDLIRSTIEASMLAFTGTDEAPGLLVKDTINVIMPALSAYDPTTRKISGIRISADLSNAVHGASIIGTVSN